jgi:hypothetical protein
MPQVPKTGLALQTTYPNRPTIHAEGEFRSK